MKLRIVLAVAACVGIYLAHGVIMYGFLGYTSKDQGSIELAGSIGLMLALMGWAFRLIVYRKGIPSCFRGRVVPLWVVVVLCIVSSAATFVACRLALRRGNDAPPSIGAEIEMRNGSWWRKMSKSEIESAKQIPFEAAER